MGKATGFLEFERKDNEIVEPLKRICNYDEFHKYLNSEERIKQGARCMNCGVPMCQSAIELKGMVTGCPLHNLIPEWNDEIYNSNVPHALSRLLKTNPFPEFTGRVCPALCEKACINGIDSLPVTVHENELYIIETAYNEGLIKANIPSVRTNYKIAVIGSGPSGLAVANRLNQRGHNVTVYEKDDRIGGLLMYGIPNMKLDKKVIFRKEKQLKEEGIVFKTGCDVLKQDKEELLKQYDAIILAAGSKKERPFTVKGADLKGVHYAVDFLKSTTKSLLESGLKEGGYISAKDKRVVILGGGDTGNDCLATSIRHGCKNVVQIEMMPKPPLERTSDNKWPEWPKVLKTDYGQEEAIALFKKDPRVYSTTIKEVIGKDDAISAIKTVEVKFENRQLVEVEGSEKTIECDLLILATGFVGAKDELFEYFGVEKTARGTFKTDDSFKTNVEKVFACGDCRRGQSLVVWAISEGKACARAVDAYLNGYTNLE